MSQAQPSKDPSIEDLERRIAVLTGENRELRERAHRNDSPDFQQRIEELESLLELLPVGIAIAYDPACREMRTNTAFNRMLGLEPSENASKTGARAEHLPFRVFRDGQEVDSRDLPMQVAAREGIAVEGSRCEIHRADEKTVTLYGMVKPLFDWHGHPRGSIGVFMDITEREALLEELRAALAQVRTLTGLLRICANCKKICETDGSWSQLESYLREHSGAEFTHGYCPSCAETFLAEMNG